MEEQSDKEITLHKRFKIWDEATTFTRYLMVMLFGVMMYDFSFGSDLFYIFILSVFINSFCYYSMKLTLESIIKERNRFNQSSM